MNPKKHHGFLKMQQKEMELTQITNKWPNIQNGEENGKNGKYQTSAFALLEVTNREFVKDLTPNGLPIATPARLWGP